MNRPIHIDAETLSAFCDGEVDESEAQRIEGHIATCEKCTRTLEEITQIRDLVRLLGRQTAPERFAGRVVHRVRRRTRGRFFHSRWQVGAPFVAAAIVIALLAALYLFTRVAFDTPRDERALPADAGELDVSDAID